jgi:hypothetical protein
MCRLLSHVLFISITFDKNASLVSIIRFKNWYQQSFLHQTIFFVVVPNWWSTDRCRSAPYFKYFILPWLETSLLPTSDFAAFPLTFSKQIICVVHHHLSRLFVLGWGGGRKSTEKEKNKFWGRSLHFRYLRKAPFTWKIDVLKFTQYSVPL